MDEKLQQYYQQEYQELQHLFDQHFAELPLAQRQIKVEEQILTESHIEQILQGVAWMNARIRQQLDDDFPEFSQALLNRIYPQVPIPAMAIVHIHPQKVMLDFAYPLPKHTTFITQKKNIFRTTQAMQLWPIEVNQAMYHLGPPPGSLPVPDATVSTLSLCVRSLKNHLCIGDLSSDCLRFYLKSQWAYLLYEALCSQVCAIALQKKDKDESPLWLSPDDIRLSGFSREEALLPHSAQVFSGYRLFSEYFTFPEKFLFFQLQNINPEWFEACENELQIMIYFKQAYPQLAQQITAKNFLSNCVPVVNLYEQHAEPIRLDHSKTEWRVKVNQSEIYTIEQVTSLNGKQRKRYHPFDNSGHTDEAAGLWQAIRRPAYGETTSGWSEMFLRLVDADFNPLQQQNTVLDVSVLCTDLLNSMTFLPSEVAFSFHQRQPDVVEKVTCVSRVSATQPTVMTQGLDWKLISHLSSSLLSSASEQENLAKLKSLLSLYSCSASDIAESMGIQTAQAGTNNRVGQIIDGIVGYKARRTTARQPKYLGHGLWQGTKIQLTLDEDKFPNHSTFLFATVLERFFALYSAINTFTQVTLFTQQHGEIMQWPARPGEQVLL